MNDPAHHASRRDFLTRLFHKPPSESMGTELMPLDTLRQYTDGVLWAGARGNGGLLFIAGDEGMVFRFDGENWMRENFPSTLPVHSLCANNDIVYSVGWMGLICKRMGGQWSRIQGGEREAAKENLPLFDIEADPSGKLWAVGDQGRIVEFDGSIWREHDSGTQANLRAVLPLPDGRVMAAGDNGTLLILEDGHWTTVVTDTGCPIVGMACLRDDAVIAVGGEYDIDLGAFSGRIFLYADGCWQAVDSGLTLPRLRRVRRAGDNLLICGDAGTALRWTTEGARKLSTRLRYDLHDVLSLENGRALLCGDGGTLLQESPVASVTTLKPNPDVPKWQRISNGETNCTLRSLWPVNNNTLIAAGDGGLVLHIEGSRIVKQETPQGLSIHALWGSSPRNIFAACDNATILRFDGFNWDIAYSGNRDTSLLAITGFGPHDIFAVGDNGYALRYNGLSWRRIETGIRQELYGLWGQDSQHLLVVGGGGLVLRFNGEQFKSFGAGTNHDLYSVSGSGLQKVFLAGLSGTLIRFEENCWHRDFSGVRSDLHALTFNERIFYAVGSNGSVLRNSDGNWEIEQSNCDNTLQAAVAIESEVYAVGSGGIVLQRGRT